MVEQLLRILEDIRIVSSIALATRFRTKLSAMSKLGVRLREFEFKVDIDSLNIPTLAKWIQNEALEL